MTPAEQLNDSLLYAQEYAGYGWRVLPIKPGTKRPPMGQWQNHATTDPATIESWWTHLYRDHGVGIATGGGLFVLDVDVSGDKVGDETLQDLEDAYGPLPETPTVVTGSGGRHYYFKAPAGMVIRNDAGKRLGAGLDIRGEGGQVVAPPTLGTLQRYEWELSPTETPVAPAPPWLLALLQPPAPAPPPTPAPAVDPGESIAATYNAETNWHGLLTADGWTLTATLPDGECRWTRPGKDERAGISATTGHGGGDYLKVFTSSIPELEQDRAYSRFGYLAATAYGGDRSQCARALRNAQAPTVPTITPWQPSAALPVTEGATRIELAHLVDWGRFWDDDHSDEEWIAYPVIPTGRAISLYAPAKAGKSTVTLAISAAVATGRPVLGKRTHPVAEVLYLDYEMTPADLQQRLLELGYGPDDDLSHLHYALLPSMPPLDTVEGAVALLEVVDATGAQLVIVDTFGRAVAGEEDHADTVRDFYRHTGLSLKARGITYLRTDHSGKDVAKGMRGSSAKNDDVDIVWQLTRADTKEGHGIRLSRTHSRISWVPDEVKIARVETDEGYDYRITGDVKLRPNGTRQQMEAMAEIGIDASWPQRAAWDHVKESGLAITQAQCRQALAMMKEMAADQRVAPVHAWQPAERVAEMPREGVEKPRGHAVKGDKGSRSEEMPRAATRSKIGARDAERVYKTRERHNPAHADEQTIEETDPTDLSIF